MSKRNHCSQELVETMLIDTHAHVQFEGFKEDADAVMRRALDAGMVVINVGSQIDTSREAMAMLEKYPQNVYAIVGLHPEHTFEHELNEENSHFTTRHEKFDYELYKNLAQHEKVVGIGECGLDYFRLPHLEGQPQKEVFPSNEAKASASFSQGFSQSGVNPHLLELSKIKESQKSAFRQQIRLAVELNKTLVIHGRPSNGTNDAYEDIYEVVKEAIGNSFFRFEVHSFTGDLETANKFIELGGFLGFNGIITFDKTGKLEEVVKNIALKNIVLETDAPYLAPVPMRGKRNEPLYVEHTARKIADWKNISFAEVAKATTENVKKLFKI